MIEEPCWKTMWSRSDDQLGLEPATPRECAFVPSWFITAIWPLELTTAIPARRMTTTDPNPAPTTAPR